MYLIVAFFIYMVSQLNFVFRFICNVFLIISNI